eukprot:12936123-Prorocentrum_lima.AAC.1
MQSCNTSGACLSDDATDARRRQISHHVLPRRLLPRSAASKSSTSSRWHSSVHRLVSQPGFETQSEQ